MSYAIITLGGKQYRVREGERLLVDRLAVEDGKTFTPNVLLVGGDGEPQLDPAGVVVTAKVLGQQRGPKIRIGKYKKRTGYKRHTGFRAALTQIEIESIGGARAAAKPKPETVKPESAVKPGAAKAASATPEAAKPESVTAEPAGLTESAGLPGGYARMTVATIKDAAGSWDTAALTSALEYERAHGNRKGAIAALESALAENGKS
jgi:large subunit ribosomal protein L21